MKKIPEEQTKPTRNQRLARWGESKAAELLLNKGLQILSRNLHTPFGEIDLVAGDEESLIFVEVKTRSSQAYGFPEQAVNSRKSLHILQSAEWFMQNHPECSQDYQIDVVALTVNPKNWEEFSLEWFENAVS